MLEDMEHELENLCEDKAQPAIVRLAAQAALIMIGKYYALTDDCEVYRIALGKLFVWFETFISAWLML